MLTILKSLYCCTDIGYISLNVHNIPYFIIQYYFILVLIFHDKNKIILASVANINWEASTIYGKRATI